MFRNVVKDVETESVDEFLARGGKIRKIAEGDTYKRKTRKSTNINAQALLDKAMGTANETDVIAFLKSQGYKVW